MSDLSLTADEFTEFSVPHTLCMAGECQYFLGLPSIVIAVNLRVQALVRETSEEFQLQLVSEDADAGAREVIAQWQGALAKLAVDDPEELDGLHISLGFGEAGPASLSEAVLSSPAVAVALVCAVKAHRGRQRSMSARDAAELAAAALQELRGDGHSRPDRYFAECLVCIEGNARCASSDSGTLNVQLMIPPESMILAINQQARAPQGALAWEEVLLGALRKIGPAGAELLARTEHDMSALFELSAEVLDDRETSLLYGLLRVRELISAYLERLGDTYLDNDLLAELCDEESEMLEDYFGFPSAFYREVRSMAGECGALGAKLTYAFGAHPALIILAPGRRDEVTDTLAREFNDCRFLPVELDPVGAGSTPTEWADDGTESE